MINSRACRSAIMFNDVHMRPQAEAPIRRLSMTQMPFRCAHGRINTVPLVELGASTKEFGGREVW